MSGHVECSFISIQHFVSRLGFVLGTNFMHNNVSVSLCSLLGRNRCIKRIELLFKENHFTFSPEMARAQKVNTVFV